MKSGRVPIDLVVQDFCTHVQALTGAFFKFANHMYSDNDEHNQTLMTNLEEVFNLMDLAGILPSDFADWQGFMQCWIDNFSRARVSRITSINKEAK